ncbi:SEL1-like repeat protein [Catenovulum sp. SM1970]|uniref:energy transducer TonB n=1 Tax=Marinifaba aquimaris TaxID=2741323 RepID=UPI001573A9B3|nr:energy transducer TonB [Marinifaba aquimaris]NTS76149.1 SEL1-like repeat protein [Marinifaba aquimaris]
MPLARFFIFLALLFSSIARADLLAAKLNYQQKAFPKAFTEFTELAKLGNTDAIYNLGVMYLHGQGTNKNLAAAFHCFNAAAQQGMADAVSTADLVKQVASKNPNFSNELNLIAKALPFAEIRSELLPELTEQGTRQQQSYINKLEHYIAPTYPERAKAKGIEGWVWLQFDVLGQQASNIKVIDSYPEKTFELGLLKVLEKWRFDVTQQGYDQQLVFHFSTRKGQRYQSQFFKQKRKYQERVNQLINSAEEGNAQLQFHVANWLAGDEHNLSYLLKSHWSSDNADMQLLLQSAQNNYPQAQFRLAAMLMSGNGVVQDSNKAKAWLAISAANGFEPAKQQIIAQQNRGNAS